MPKYKHYHSLPDGKSTLSANRYIKEWGKILKPLAKILDSRVISYDPSINLSTNEDYQQFNLPLNIAKKIVNLSQNK